ncbi:CPBP family intramembrane glutamic endopeptidase [Carboxylicivirga sp. M1479]|uniref:CPBP family intramembrane glutamic endopeptidase n=1 Tax=Carboxylicivirga sp. M1479 TaxID=2594476 RepID=UPI001178167B|nr:type II CAAX endopeptidase family protein [Carboxylicivirga sp. M1479]TRX61581.1 CPBP family intramembrane metalloprotease [Carboxylicivirga sp. M1479]
MNISKPYPNLAQSWGITGIVIACMLLFTPINVVLNPILGKEYSMMAYYILTMGVAFFLSHLIRKNETSNKTYQLQIASPQLLPLIILAAWGLLLGVVTPIGNLIPMPKMFQEMFKELAELKGFGAFVMMVVAAPLFEELIFRGIILDGMLKRYTPAKAIFWSAFLFGFVHLNPWQFVTGLVIGAFIGWIYYHTRSLTVSIIIHAAVNCVGFFMRFFIDDTDMDATLVEAYESLSNAVLITSGAILTASLCIFILMRRFSNKQVKPTV